MIHFSPNADRDASAMSSDGVDSGIDMKPDVPKENQAKLVNEKTDHNENLPRRFWSTIPSKERAIKSSHTQRQSLKHHRHLHTANSRQSGTPRRNIITWDMATRSRPPLKIDMSGPTPTTYSPCNKPLYETNAPAYSFRGKETFKASNAQVGLKQIFRADSPFTLNTSCETHWPSPFHYQQKPTLGPRQVNKSTSPSYSFGWRRSSTGNRKVMSDQIELYYPEIVALNHIKRAPAFTIGSKLATKDVNPIAKGPAPNVYDPLKGMHATRRSQPAFTVCGVRRNKRHDLGPFFTL